MRSLWGFSAGAAALAASLSLGYAQTPPSIAMTLKPSSAVEGSRFLVTFKRSGDLSRTTSVSWAVSGAVDGVDFGKSALPSGTLNFSAGQAQKGFWLATVDDATVEPDEAFDVVLSAPRNATIAAGSARATIVNNDIATRSPLTLLNPSHSAWWAQEDAFINHILLTGKDYGLWVKNGWFDPASMRFVQMPSSGNIRLGPVRGGFVQGAGNFYAGKWILDWQGDGDLTITGGAGAMTRVSANRIEEDYDPAAHGIASPIVRIKRIGPGGVWNIRYYRASHEALLNAGEVFDPRWLADASRFDVFRPMDWTGVNSDRELFAADRPPANRPFYEDGRVPDAILVRAAIQSGAELWLNAPGLLGCPPAVAAIVRDTSQPMSTRIAAAKMAFDQVMASPEPLHWARAIVAELNAQGYPLTRRLLVELDNEVWNINFHASTNFHAGIGQAVAARFPGLAPTMRTGYGYRSAQYAAAFAQALAEGGRGGQVWTMVLAGQTFDPRKTIEAVAAVPAFGGPEPLSRYGVATTNYLFGGFQWHPENRLFGAALDQATWRQQWLAELAADPAALSKRITDYMLAPTAGRANIAYFIAKTLENKAEGEKAGIRWIGNFEGDSKDFMDPVLAQNAGAVSLYRQWYESADHGRVIAAVASEIKRNDPTAIMATYVFCAARRTPTTPFVECTPFDQSGGDNAAWNVLLKP